MKGLQKGSVRNVFNKHQQLRHDKFTFGFFLFMREEKNMNILIFYSNNNKNKKQTLD